MVKLGAHWDKLDVEGERRTKLIKPTRKEWKEEGRKAGEKLWKAEFLAEDNDRLTVNTSGDWESWPLLLNLFHARSSPAQELLDEWFPYSRVSSGDYSNENADFVRVP